jgi:hypothetical protein
MFDNSQRAPLPHSPVATYIRFSLLYPAKARAGSTFREFCSRRLKEQKKVSSSPETALAVDSHFRRVCREPFGNLHKLSVPAVDDAVRALALRRAEVAAGGRGMEGARAAKGRGRAGSVSGVCV